MCFRFVGDIYTIHIAMNIPEIYLTEPYNAYSPNKKKKHWHEIVEEQALMAKILSEANRNATLAPNMPNQATPEIQAVTPAGSGGMPMPQFFNPSMTIGYTQSTLTASAPVLVQFTNTGDASLYALDTVYLSWNFGDGTTALGPNPSHIYTTTGSNFAVTMSAIAKVDTSDVTTAASGIQILPPTVSPSFTLGRPATLTASYYTASAGNSIPFINGTTTNNTSNPITYLWVFGSGSAPANYGTSTTASPTYSYATAGTYTVRLQATGSFGIQSATTRKIQIV
jgi:PKD repeat protein